MDSAIDIFTFWWVSSFPLKFNIFVFQIPSSLSWDLPASKTLTDSLGPQSVQVPFCCQNVHLQGSPHWARTQHRHKGFTGEVSLHIDMGLASYWYQGIKDRGDTSEYQHPTFLQTTAFFLSLGTNLEPQALPLRQHLLYHDSCSSPCCVSFSSNTDTEEFKILVEDYAKQKLALQFCS